ncbi:MAG: hypothetical protein WBG95_03305 [Sulfitobacter sp.]
MYAQALIQIMVITPIPRSITPPQPVGKAADTQISAHAVAV